MGLATAPALMQTVMRAVAAALMHILPGIYICVYLDDFLVTAPYPDPLLPLPALMRSRGLRINDGKSVLIPSTHLTYLGLTVDLQTRHLTISPPLREQVHQAISVTPHRSAAKPRKTHPRTWRVQQCPLISLEILCFAAIPWVVRL